MTKRATVSVELPGGLGNQLFALAFCLKLCQEDRAQIVLDGRHYQWHTARQIEIDSLLPKLSKFFKMPRFRGSDSRLPPQINRLVDVIPNGRKTIVEGRVPLSCLPASLPRRSRVKGYFQDGTVINELGHEFVDTVAAWVRSAWKVGDSSTPLVPRELRSIEGGTVVHLRRGDFRSSAANGILSLDYIIAAIESMGYEGERLHFISDDDPEKLRNDLNQLRLLGYDAQPVYNGHRLDARSTLLVLLLARELILANSTLSWWGARLNLGRKIIAPSEWVRQAAYRPRLDLPNTVVETVVYKA